MDLRAAVTAAVKIQNYIARNDLIDPTKTTDSLIHLLARATLSPAQGGLGYRLLLTAINSDHHDDSALGPHSHHAGFAVDCWPQDVAELPHFLTSMARQNDVVRKIGLGGSSQKFFDVINWNNMVVFKDNNSDHIHFQTQQGS